MVRNLSKVLGRLTLGLAAGVTLGAGYWAVAMALKGHNLASAIQGKVADALDTLQALMTLGGLCGAGVGLCWGITELVRCEAIPGTPPESDTTEQ